MLGPTSPAHCPSLVPERLQGWRGSEGGWAWEMEGEPAAPSDTLSWEHEAGKQPYLGLWGQILHKSQPHRACPMLSPVLVPTSLQSSAFCCKGMPSFPWTDNWERQLTKEGVDPAAERDTEWLLSCQLGVVGGVGLLGPAGRICSVCVCVGRGTVYITKATPAKCRAWKTGQ